MVRSGGRFPKFRVLVAISALVFGITMYSAPALVSFLFLFTAAVVLPGVMFGVVLAWRRGALDEVRDLMPYLFTPEKPQFDKNYPERVTLNSPITLGD